MKQPINEIKRMQQLAGLNEVAINAPEIESMLHTAYKALGAKDPKRIVPPGSRLIYKDYMNDDESITFDELINKIKEEYDVDSIYDIDEEALEAFLKDETKF
jgi:hypothetical protein